MPTYALENFDTGGLASENLTVRDEFAMRIFAALVQADRAGHYAVVHAYQWADEMLDQRAKMRKVEVPEPNLFKLWPMAGEKA